MHRSIVHMCSAVFDLGQKGALLGMSDGADTAKLGCPTQPAVPQTGGIPSCKISANDCPVAPKCSYPAGIALCLRRCRLFQALSEGELLRFAEWVQPKTFKRGDHVFRQGQPTIACFVVQNGAVEVSRLSEGGSLQVLHVFGPGDSFAETALGGLENYPASAKALVDSRILAVPKREFVEQVKLRPDLAFCIIASLSHHLRELVGLIEDLRSKNAQSRLVAWLLGNASPKGVVQIPGSKGDLANQLGMTQETLSRLFSMLTREGVIRVARRSIQIENILRLREFGKTSERGAAAAIHPQETSI